MYQTFTVGCDATRNGDDEDSTVVSIVLLWPMATRGVLAIVSTIGKLLDTLADAVCATSCLDRRIESISSGSGVSYGFKKLYQEREREGEGGERERERDGDIERNGVDMYHSSDHCACSTSSLATKNDQCRRPGSLKGIITPRRKPSCLFRRRWMLSSPSPPYSVALVTERLSTTSQSWLDGMHSMRSLSWILRPSSRRKTLAMSGPPRGSGGTPSWNAWI